MSHSISASWKSESEYRIKISLCCSSRCGSSDDCFERSSAALASFQDFAALGSFDSKLFLIHHVLYLDLKIIRSGNYDIVKYALLVYVGHRVAWHVRVLTFINQTIIDKLVSV